MPLAHDFFQRLGSQPRLLGLGDGLLQERYLFVHGSLCPFEW
jgi:hypothetical protein